MLKNNIELDVKVKCIEGNTTQAKIAEEVGTSASYVSRVINGGDKVVNKTFIQIMEALGYDVELTYAKRDSVKLSVSVEKTMGIDMLEKQFHEEMTGIYTRAKKECHYTAKRFLDMVNEMGGLMTAKKLIYDDKVTDGFAKLWECGRLDLSVENLVLKPKFKALFTDKERKLCLERLEQYGYHPKV